MDFFQGSEFAIMYMYDAAIDDVMADERNGFSPYMYAGGGSAIIPLPRVRKLFPETWLWSNTSTG